MVLKPQDAKLLTANYFEKHHLIFLDATAVNDPKTHKLSLRINAHGLRGFFKLKMDDNASLFFLSRKTGRWVRVKEY